MGNTDINVRYEHQNNSNYLVVEDGEQYEEYQYKMLKRNKPEHFLEFSTYTVNGRYGIYYDITSRQQLSKFYEYEKMTMEDVKSICVNISETVRIADDYMLDIDNVMIEPKYIFMDVGTRKLMFIYHTRLSSSGFGDGLKTLFEFILEHFDHGLDKESVVKLYEVYQKVLVGEYDPYNLIRMFGTVRDSAAKDSAAKEPGANVSSDGDERGLDDSAGKNDYEDYEDEEEYETGDAAGSRVLDRRASNRCAPAGHGKIASVRRDRQRKSVSEERGRNALGRQGKIVSDGQEKNVSERHSRNVAERQGKIAAERQGKRREISTIIAEQVLDDVEVNSTKDKKNSWLFMASLLLIAVGALEIFLPKILPFDLSFSWAAIYVAAGVGMMYLVKKMEGAARGKTVTNIEKRGIPYVSHVAAKKEKGAYEEYRAQEESLQEEKAPVRKAAQEKKIPVRKIVQELDVEHVRERHYEPARKQEKPRGKKEEIFSYDDVCGETMLLSDYTAEKKKNLRFVAVNDGAFDGVVMHKQGEESQVETIENSKYPYVIGCMEKMADIVIKSQVISRMHCCIYHDEFPEDAYAVEDLNATNGTFLNGERLSNHERKILADGDILKLAALSFKVEIT